MGGQYYFNWNLRSLSVCSCSCEDSRVPPLNLYYDISIAEDLHWIKPVDRNVVRNGGTTRTHSSLCSPSKSLTMCSSDFVFQKYKQDCAFRVSGVLQLAKTGPPVTKNFPLRRLFPSDAMMAWRFYALCDVKCTNFDILTARKDVAHFDSNWPTLKLEKKFVRTCPKPKLKNYESEDHRLQYYGIKK